MQPVLALLVATLVAVAGCGGAAPTPTMTPVAADEAPRRSLVVDGRERSYRVHLPPTLRAGAPLLLVLHGAGGNGARIAAATGFDTVADARGWVVVYPDGTGEKKPVPLTWNAGDCCGYAVDEHVDDVAFLTAVLDDVEARYGTDPTRAFATGFSNGGMMSYRLACDTGRIAAIAVVGASLVTDGCAPRRAVPALAVHGTDDVVVPLAGGASPYGRILDGIDFRSYAASLAFWARAAGCDPAATSRRDGAVRTERHAGCRGALEVTGYVVRGGGHVWPGSPAARESSDEPFLDTTSVIARFFARHGG